MKFQSASERYDHAYSCLTRQVQYLHAKAIAQTNAQILRERDFNPTLFEYAENDQRGFSAYVRFRVFANLQPLFKPMAYSVFRKQNSYLYQQIYDTHIIRWYKAEFASNPLTKSPTSDIYHFLELPIELDEPAALPPIQNLFPLTARYIIEGMLITEFYYNDQQGKNVMSTVPLDLTLSKLPVMPREPRSGAKSPFTWKGNTNSANKTDLG